MMSWIPVFIVISFVFNSGILECAEIDPDAIEKGLETGEAITELMCSDSFHSTLSSLGKGIGQYLGVIGPALGFILSFVGGDEHMEFMKKMLEKIESRFDLVDDKFYDVSKQIEWSTIQINLGEHSKTIKILNEALQSLRKAEKEVIDDYKDRFIRLYDNKWSNDPLVLYNSITSSDLFHKNVIEGVKKNMDNHRGRVQKFMLGLTELVIRGVNIELSYLEVKNKTLMRKDRETYWANKIKSMKEAMSKADSDIKRNYLAQTKTDLAKLLRNNEGKSHEEFAKIVYEFLNEKYSWRKWIVVVYDELLGGDKHWVKYCGGTSIFRTNGRNIVVASVLDSKMPIKKDKSLENSKVLNSIELLGTKKWYKGVECFDAKTLYSKLPSEVQNGCEKYSGAGVIKLQSHVALEAPSDRIVVQRRRCSKDQWYGNNGYTFYLFG